jgi:hypothetical protein
MPKYQPLQTLHSNKTAIVSRNRELIDLNERQRQERHKTASKQANHSFNQPAKAPVLDG